MQRERIEPRADWRQRCEDAGFRFHSIDGVYWDESVCYRFTQAQVEHLEAVSTELHEMSLAAVQHVIDREDFERFAIPREYIDYLVNSWKNEEPSLFGRFDLSWDGDLSGQRPPKLLEYNADTPTALIEASVAQWYWLEDQKPDADQFNSLHEKLIARLGELGRGRRLDLAVMPGASEDDGFIAYLDDCAQQAGLETQRLAMADIGVTAEPRFVDMQDRPIELMFKLYPWEWMFADEYGRSPALKTTQFLEPPWKAILSNKGMLALLWKMAPGHPNLLPAFFEHDPAKAELGAHFARKPLYSREGANVLLVDGDRVVAREEGSYGAEGYVRQALSLLPDFGGMRPVVGSWVIGDEACGVGLREDNTAITRNSSRFLPHVILD